MCSESKARTRYILKARRRSKKGKRRKKEGRRIQVGKIETLSNYRKEYRANDKEATRRLRKDNKEWEEQVEEIAETVAEIGNTKVVYDATRKLANRQSRK